MTKLLVAFWLTAAIACAQIPFPGAIPEAADMPLDAEQVAKLRALDFSNKMDRFIESCNRLLVRVNETDGRVWPAKLARQCAKAFDKMAKDPLFRTK